MAALVLNNVQTGTIAFTTETSKTATITSVDTSKCFIVTEHQTAQGGNNPDRQLFRGVLTNSTTITVERTAGIGNATVRWWAVEFSSGITVSHFTGTSTNNNVAIGSTVDLSKTFAILSWKASDDAEIHDHGAAAVDIVSTTNFQVKVVDNSVGTVTWTVQIIEFDGAADPVVEAVTIVMTGTSASGTIGAVTIADCSVFGGAVFSDAFSNSKRTGFDWTLASTTSLQVDRIDSGGTLTCICFVVDWGANVDIRTGSSTLTVAEGTSETQTFSALAGTDDAIAFVRGGSPTFGGQGNHAGGPDNEDYVETSLDSTTQITVTRGSGSSNDFGPYTWQVIDFSGFAVAVGGAEGAAMYHHLQNMGIYS